VQLRWDHWLSRPPGTPKCTSTSPDYPYTSKSPASVVVTR